jgi:ribosome-associated translation inhibitor RaiA
MDIPLELSFHNIESSDALKTAVKEHVGRLEQIHDHIIGCRVVIELPHKSQKALGNQPDVHIVVRVPGKEIVVSKELAHEGHKKNATDAYAVLDNAFAVAASQLRDYRRISHGDVKYKSDEPRDA